MKGYLGQRKRKDQGRDRDRSRKNKLFFTIEKGQKKKGKRESML